MVRLDLVSMKGMGNILPVTTISYTRSLLLFFYYEHNRASERLTPYITRNMLNPPVLVFFNLMHTMRLKTIIFDSFNEDQVPL